MANADFDPVQVGVLGATSFVGATLLQRLKNTSMKAIAYTRREVKKSSSGVEWRNLESELPLSQKINTGRAIPLWVCLAPIAVLPKYFNLLETHGVKRLVVLSSTSRFTKQDSSDLNEQILVRHLADAEAIVQEWAEGHGVEWIILRPTLI